MTRILRETLLQIREAVFTWGPFMLVGLAALVAAYWLLDPTPPRRVVLATGPEGSAYEAFGKRYAAELAAYGIEVTLRPTSGSRENLRLLRDGAANVDIAFVQGGASESARAREGEKNGLEVVSLGSLFYEPVWIFHRTAKAKSVSQLTALRGWSVSVGQRGSGTPGLVSRLLAANLMERDDILRRNLDDTSAVVALLGGKLDAAVLVSAPEAPIVQMLLQTPGVGLFEFRQAEAYSRRYGFISPVVLPRGVADLSRNVPASDVTLIAATTSLVAREDIHPALIQLFMQAATRIHGGPGWIAEAGRFPSPERTEYPLASEAERFYRSGPPFLQRYLPFWVANLVDRMWVALFSIVAILIPLSRILPPLYQFRVRSRVFRWYRQLREIEESHERKSAPPQALLADLDRLESRAARIVLPLSYADELYALRQHIELVRERLARSA